MNTFQISIMQDNFVYQSALVSGEPIEFERMSRKAIATLIAGMVTAKMDYPSATSTRKAKDGTILEVIQRRAKCNQPFEVYITNIVDGEERVLVADRMRFTLTEKSIMKQITQMPKRLWLMVNSELLATNPLLAFQAPEYYGKALIG